MRYSSFPQYPWGLLYDPKQLLWSSTHKLYVLTLCCIFRFWCSFDKRWSIEWWISVWWQQPKVRRILRGGLSGGACNWQLARQLGRNFSTFSWQILVRLWLHTTQLADSCSLALVAHHPFYLLPSHTRKGYIRGWPTKGNAILIRNTIRDGGITLLTRLTKWHKC